MALERDGSDIETNDDSLEVESIMNVVKYLRSDERVLLEHVYWERLTYREIAVILGVSENAVGIRINRAKRNLKLLLDENPDSVRSSRIIDEEVEG
jgi:RNA polymerase sigma factor (sigma-70 family)